MKKDPVKAALYSYAEVPTSTSNCANIPLVINTIISIFLDITLKLCFITSLLVIDKKQDAPYILLMPIQIVRYEKKTPVKGSCFTAVSITRLWRF